MAHLLYRLGASALRPRHLGLQVLPPLISLSNAMQLREQFYKEGQVWPYEDIVPGPSQPPPGVDRYLRRQAASDLKAVRRQKEIEAAMAKMPALIEEYRAARRLDMKEVTPLDRLLLSQRAIREKYVKRRLTKIG